MPIPHGPRGHTKPDVEGSCHYHIAPEGHAQPMPSPCLAQRTSQVSVLLPTASLASSLPACTVLTLRAALLSRGWVLDRIIVEEVQRRAAW